MTILSDTAIDQLRQNARSMVRELGLLNDAYFEIGVTLAERHLLIELAAIELPTMKEIAERLLLDKSTISRLIAQAVKKGYIECLTSQEDKRKRFLNLTEKGKQTLQAFEPIAFHQTKQALLTLTHEEGETVYQGVALYAKGLRNSRLSRHKSHRQDKEEVNLHKKMADLKDVFSRLNHLGYDLKPYQHQDEKFLHKIFQEIVESGSQFPYECSSIEEFRRQFFKPESQVYVCHSHQGKVVGGFYLRLNFSGELKKTANAAYMIKKDYRGKSIGSLLIQASLHLAKDMGFQAMQFNKVFSQNRLAVKLYERLGFKIIATLPEAVKNSDEILQKSHVMYRSLDDL